MCGRPRSGDTDAVGDYRQTLRELAIRDQRLLSEVLASDEANLRASALDARSHALRAMRGCERRAFHDRPA